MFQSLDPKSMFSSPELRDCLIDSLQSAGIGTWNVEMTDEALVSFDSHCRDILGLREGNNLSLKSALLSINEDDREYIYAAMLASQDPASGGKFDLSYRVTGIHDNVVRTVRSVGCVRYNDNGEITGATGISIHTHSQHELEKQILKFRTMVNTSRDIVAISNPEGKMEFVNEAGLAIFGMQSDHEYQHFRSSDFYADGEEKQQEIYRALEQNGEWSGNVSLKHPLKSETVPGWGEYRLILDPATGKIIGRSAHIRDLRAEHAAGKALRESEERLRKVIEQAPVGIAVLKGTNLVIESVNARMLTIWDKDSNIAGSRITDALPELVLTDYIEVMQRVFETGEPFSGFATRVLNPKLSGYLFDIVYNPLINEDNEIEGIIILATDVTQQMKTVEDLAKSESRFRGLLEHAPFATSIYLGEDLIIELANDPMFRIWGKDRSIINMRLGDALPELEGQPFLELLADVFRTGVPYVATEEPAELMINGKLVRSFFNFTYQPLFDSSGKVYAIMNMAIDVTEQVLSRKALEKSQNELLAYFEQSPVAIATINRENLVFDLANPFYAELVGRTVDELVGKPLLEVLPEIAGQGFDRLINEVIDTGVPFRGDGVPVDVMRDGKLTRIYVDLHYHPKRNSMNEIVGILVVASDVTKQMNTIEELEKSEERFRGLIDHAPVATCVFTGENMVIELANKPMLRMWGKDRSSLGKPLLEGVPELEGQPFFGLLRDVYRTGVPHVGFEDPAELMVDGKLSTFYFNYTYQPLYDSSGKIYGVMDMAVDVTEQVEVRLKLQETETRLRGAIEVAGLATWSFDLTRQRFSYSDRFTKWLGFTTGEKSIEEALSPLPDEYRDVVKREMTNAIRHSGNYDFIHPVLNRTTGEKRIIHSQGRVFYDQEGKPQIMHGTAQDITIEQELQTALMQQVKERTEQLAIANDELQSSNRSLEEINEQLSMSNNDLSQYAYVASHDLQEPLRKIRMFSSMLKTKGNIPDDQLEIIQKIDKSSERMSLLIGDLLEFSRTNKDTKSTTHVDLNEIVKAVLVDFELLIAEKNAKVTIGRLPNVNAVSLQMNQLFYNLLNNALKFSVPERDLKISVEAYPVSAGEIAEKFPTFKIQEKSHYCDIVISDNGIGFSEEYAEQIFEVFKRLHEKSIYPGSGIGLALCRKIVNHHNGYIYANSVKGEGTDFHIIMPVIR